MTVTYTELIKPMTELMALLAAPMDESTPGCVDMVLYECVMSKEKRCLDRVTEFQYK
jgi:hypothetical protein